MTVLMSPEATLVKRLLCLREIKTPDGIGVPVRVARTVAPIHRTSDVLPCGLVPSGTAMLTCNIPGIGEVTHTIDTLASLNATEGQRGSA